MRYSYSDYQNMLRDLRNITSFQPAVGAVLGSGLGGFVNNIKVEAIVPYSDIPGLPTSTNKAHKGQFVFGYFERIPVVLMQGRLHCYEGYTPEEVVAPIRLMGLMGIKGLVLSNAAGGITYKPGDLMMIIDHISSFMTSPLSGENIEEFGPRFPDMSDVYNQEKTNTIYKLGVENNLPMARGVYCQFNGPQYESKAEVRMAKFLGADAVGMSTAIEAIASNHMGIKTVGISLITNYAAGISKTKLDDKEVVEMGKKSAADITKLFSLALKEMYHGQ